MRVNWQLWFYRDEFNATKPSDKIESWELGPLRVRVSFDLPMWIARILIKIRVYRGKFKRVPA